MKQLFFLICIVQINGSVNATSIVDMMRYSNASHIAQQEKWDAAYQKMSDLVVTNYDRADLLYDTGVVAYRNNNFEQAKNYFERALAVTKDASLKERIYFNLGNTHVALKQLQNALTDYQEVLKINKDNAQAKHNWQKVKEMLEQQKQQQENQDKQKEDQDQQQDKDQQQNGESENNQQQKQEQSKDNKDQQQKGGSQNQDNQNNQDQKDNTNQKDSGSNDGKDGKENQPKDGKRDKGGKEKQNDRSQGDGQQENGKQDKSGEQGEQKQENENDQQSKKPMSNTGDKKEKDSEQSLEDQRQSSADQKESRKDQGKKEQNKNEQQNGEKKQVASGKQTQGDAKNSNESPLQMVERQDATSKFGEGEQWMVKILENQEGAEKKAQKQFMKSSVNKKQGADYGKNNW